jgi:hypothetical protein
MISNRYTMRRIPPNAAAVLVALACFSCSNPTRSEPHDSSQAPAAPEIPAAIQAAAQSDLGSEAEVLVYGDLAKNGKTQALVVNRLKTTPKGTVPGVLISRAAILEEDDGHWKEVLRCDEHLKNPKGFLGGNPFADVPSWRLQYEQNPQKGLELYFTPLAKPAGGYVLTLGIRWNPQAKRYESLDRNFEHFLGELPSLDIPQSQVRM